MIVLAFVLSLAISGHCQDQDLIQAVVDPQPLLNPYQRAPFLFNPITYTFYSTIRTVSTVSAYCYTTTACPVLFAKYNEDIAPAVVQSVEPTVAPAEEPVTGDAIREARHAQYDPYGPYYAPGGYYPSPYYAPYIRGSFGSFGSSGQALPAQRFLLSFTNTFVTLFTNIITQTFSVTLGCTINPIPAPACQPVPAQG